MRKLSKKQKQLLSETGVHSVMSLNDNCFNLIESLNDYETFYQDADRYLNDEYFKRFQKKLE
jgi:hypothetical protein